MRSVRVAAQLDPPGSALDAADSLASRYVGERNARLRRIARLPSGFPSAKVATNVLYNLHLLRVIAALGVVYFHTTSTAGLNLDWDVGSRGVDVFFVITGFIISYIAVDRPHQFLRRRLIRVVPFYWAATLAVFVAAVAAPHVFNTTSGDVPHLLSSLAFVARKNATTDEMMPTLVLGWSLNFEMFFYVMFALSLLVAPRYAPQACVASILAFVLVVHAQGGSNDILEFYGRPIVFEFCYGVLAFYVFRWLSARKDALSPVGALKWVLLAIFVSGIVLILVLEHRLSGGSPRYVSAGIPAFFIVLSALLLERIYGVSLNNKVVYLLGEASYIIYLVHPYIVFAVLRLIVRDAALPGAAITALILALLAITSAVAVALHVWFEKPMLARLRNRFVPVA